MSMSSGLRFHESVTDPTSDVALTDGGEIVDGRPPIVTFAMKLIRAHPPGTFEEYQTINADLVVIALCRVLKGRTVADYLSEKLLRPAGMEADANWVLDKTGIERGGCCISATLRDYARFGLFIAKGDLGPAGTVLPVGWVDKARTPVWPVSVEGSAMVGFGGCARTGVTRPWAHTVSRSPFIPRTMWSLRSMPLRAIPQGSALPAGDFCRRLTQPQQVDQIRITRQTRPGVPFVAHQRR